MATMIEEVYQCLYVINLIQYNERDGQISVLSNQSFEQLHCHILCWHGASFQITADADLHFQDFRPPLRHKADQYRCFIAEFCQPWFNIPPPFPLLLCSKFSFGLTTGQYSLGIFACSRGGPGLDEMIRSWSYWAVITPPPISTTDMTLYRLYEITRGAHSPVVNKNVVDKSIGYLLNNHNIRYPNPLLLLR